jgi:hypothetical protein
MKKGRLFFGTLLLWGAAFRAAAEGPAVLTLGARDVRRDAERSIANAQNRLKKDKPLEALLLVNDVLEAFPSDSEALLLLHQINAVLRTRHQAGTIPSGTSTVRFSYKDPAAKHVSVVGEFTSWRPAPMQRSEDGVWTAPFVLPPGDYAYLFAVDGRQMRDPGNALRTDGGWSLLRVQGNE